ncbi:hypothetical protein I308_102520 [Cryptococcus tetragattii IND107]|uniref:Uncharacterized protein n=1 Tax=Cryptococcus tetragattii IND107 TaxID=1296105 RepID=A0ABR3BTS9_9TREE
MLIKSINGRWNLVTLEVFDVPRRLSFVSKGRGFLEGRCQEIYELRELTEMRGERCWNSFEKTRLASELPELV